ncbi:PREDICTED: glutathione S-transferase D7-like [Ceratosolen solmsi marchali]|uniref:Glutathione S-transferase D7-like n=1 Tax=Ceratosolen solmsi marchali TaxID=326594 RepID=A0AAJ6YH32_9HYME|nr:PREDICTED: glutathione S-transferase D7-like [Ceratosolen solmsi marchali]
MELYYNQFSPPSRAVRMTAEYLGLSLKLNCIDTLKGEQLTQEFETINSAKKIPILVDGDLKLAESRAIMIYLVDKYGKNNSRILPSDPCGRALVNLALHFDIGKLFRSIEQYYFPIIFKLEETPSAERYEKLKEAFGILDRMVESQDYVAGRNLTIADISIITTVTTAEAFGFNIIKYKNVMKWIDRVKVAIPGYKKINVEGIEMLKKRLSGQMEN